MGKAKAITIKGVTRTTAEWIALIGITRRAYDERRQRHWPREIALTAPRDYQYKPRIGPKTTVTMLKVQLQGFMQQTHAKLEDLDRRLRKWGA